MTAQSGTVSHTAKLAVLVLMSLMTTIYLLLIRWTRITSSEKYITTTAVAMQESMKFLFAFAILIWDSRGISSALHTVKLEAYDQPMSTLKMAVPSVVYTLQNNMNFIALSNLDVPVQQVLYQLKIPAAAFCSVLLMGKSLSYQQWSACFMVFAGLAMVEYNPSSASGTNSNQNVLVGVGAVFVAVFCSAFAGVYFEKIVKKDETSIWVCNLQMYMWTTFASIIAVLTKDLSAVNEYGFFFAYSPAVWVLLVVGSVNGLIVSLVLKYADNIVKGFATAISIVLSTIASHFLFQYDVGLGLLVGCTIICGAICLYCLPLPCLDSKFVTVATKMTGSQYDQLTSVSFAGAGEDDEINSANSTQ